MRIMESHLASRERELGEARMEAENLRLQIAELASERSRPAVAAEAYLAADRAAVLQGAPGELAELANVLHDTRAALAATQQEIRHILQDLADDVPDPDEERDEQFESAPSPPGATEPPDDGAPGIDPGVVRTVFENAPEERPRRRGLPGRRR